MTRSKILRATKIWTILTYKENRWKKLRSYTLDQSPFMPSRSHYREWPFFFQNKIPSLSTRFRYFKFSFPGPKVTFLASTRRTMWIENFINSSIQFPRKFFPNSLTSPEFAKFPDFLYFSEEWPPCTNLN